jgi:hypothetical protein
MIALAASTRTVGEELKDQHPEPPTDDEIDTRSTRLIF